MLALAINGGGIAGYAGAVLLSMVETTWGRRLLDCFDLVAGVSTGSIIAAGMGSGKNLGDIARLYRDSGPAIFKRRWQPWAGLIGCSKYKATNLARVLERELPGCMSDLEGRIMIHAVRMAPQVGMQHWKSWKSGAVDTVADVVRASCSAWTYFEPCSFGGAVYMDGGQGENNPSIHCIAEGIKLGFDLRRIRVLNIELIRAKDVRARKARGFTNGLSGVPTVPETMIKWTEESVCYASDKLLGANYLPVSLDMGIEMDDVSETAFNKMDYAASKYWGEHGHEILDFIAGD